jgi:hypothetical protein
MTVAQNESNQSQVRKFEEAARALDCDQDEGRWNERLAKVAKAKPKPDGKGK